MLSCGVCPSVCLSITFVYSVEMSNHIFKIFAPSGWHNILVCPYYTLWQYSDEDPLTGASNAGGVGRSWFSTNIWLHCVLSTVRPPSVVHRAAPDCGKLVTLITGGVVCCSREMVDEVFMTRSLNVTLKTTEQHLNVCSGKCKAEVSNNKRLHSRYCTVEANYRQTWSTVRPICNSRASCDLQLYLKIVIV